MKLDLSPESWGRVIVSTLAGTTVCVVAALYVDSFNLASMDTPTRIRSLAADVFLPIVLAVPLLVFFTAKLRELAIAHRQLTVFASTDSLTKVLNRAAFSTLVEAWLTEVRAQQSGGALLIIDADEFKSVNDRFGHDRGDEALIAIADCIKSTLRGPDIVGRLGGEEFGVFLPGTSAGQAERVAERIRASVSATPFVPGDAPHRLSVSVGGAVFERPMAFAELFRVADQQLYTAKGNGRNRVVISHIPGNPGRAAA